MSTDLFYLQQALTLAERRKGFCAPNPSVGAVMVKEGKVIGTGFHLGPGSPHAEIKALESAMETAKGATMYVTLEPCCHWGRTPPCTNALIEAGIARVVYGYADPNPIVFEKGAAQLNHARISCEHMHVPEIDAFYASYKHWHETHRPFITAKIALSLNGKIAGENGQPVQITGSELQRYTHLHRKQTDAILTTAKTILHDDPELNARYQDEIFPKRLYILDQYLRTPHTARVFKTAQSLTLFHAETTADAIQPFLDQGARCIPISTEKESLNLPEIVQHIGQDGIHDLWIEAGGRCFTAFAHANLLQRALIYFAPIWINSGQIAFADSPSLSLPTQNIHWKSLGNDVLCDIRW